MVFMAVMLGYWAGMLVQYAGGCSGHKKKICWAIAIGFGTIAGLLIA